jgi:hypothetical protein
MNLEPPSGSRISVTTDGGYPLIVVPHGNGGLMRYFVGVFLLAWLGGWFAGFRGVVSKLSSADVHAFPVMVFWLVGWTLGGAYVVYWAYRAFRPSVPEQLRLMPDNVTYDSVFPRFRPISATHPERMHGNRCFQRGLAQSLIGGNFSRSA